MSEQPDPDRLKALEERIDALKQTQEDAPRKEYHYSMASVAWRMVTELVAGLGIGFGIGLGLDAVFGTKPFLMIVFLLVGFAAGVRVMIGTAQELQEQRMKAAAAADETPADEPATETTKD